MYKTHIRKILGDMSARKLRTFLVSASIFIGVLGVIGLFTTRNLINQQLEEDIRQNELSMLDITVSAAKGVSLDNARYLETLNRQNEEGQPIAALAGIERVEGQAFYPIYFKKPGSDSFDNAEIRAYSTRLQDVQIEPVRLIEGEGTWPEVGHHQVAVEKRFADKYGFKVNDEIIFRATDEKEVTYTISGIVFHPYSFRGLTGDQPGPAVGIYAQYEDAQSILHFAGYSKFIARYKTYDLARENFEDFQQVISDISPYVPIAPTYENPAENAQVEVASIFNNVLTALALVTMVVSGFLVINVINTIIAEQKKQIGAMKALGATIQDIFLIYAGIALAYGIMGTVLAIIPGVIVGNIVTQFLAPQLDIVVEGFKWSISAILIGVALGLIVPVISAIVPVYRGVNVSIVEAMTDLGISANYGEGWLVHVIGRLPLPISGKQAISNIYQKGGRLTLTLLTLMLTVATFMATIALTISLQRELNNLFGRLHYHILVQPNEVQNQTDMQNLIITVPDIDRTAPATLVWIQIQGDYTNFMTGNNQLQIYGLDPEANVIDYVLVSGDGWFKDPYRKGVMLTRPIANQLGVKAGDDMTFIIGATSITVPVIGVDDSAFDSASMRWELLSPMAGLVTGAPRPNEYMLEIELGEQNVVVVGVDETLLTFIPGYTEQDTPGILLSQSLADALDKTAGDSLELTITGYTEERRIETIVPDAMLESSARQIMPNLEEVPENMILFGFNDLVAFTHVSLEGEPVPNAYYVTMRDDDPTVDDVDDAIDAINTTLLEQGIASRFINQVAWSEALNKQISTNTSIIFAAALLIAGVGAIGLLTTLSIAVLERQKEIGVMRSIGAGSLTVASQFLIEGLIIGFIAWILGIPVSYALARGLFNAFQLESVPFTYPPEALAFGLIGILSICAIASLGPSLGAARKTVSDILRYQ